MTSRLPVLLLACAALAAPISSSPAARGAAPAEERPPTFLVVASPSDRFGQRLIAELESLSFQAVRLDPPGEPASRTALEAAARAASALAAIRAVPSARGMEVWIADRITGKTVLRELAIDPDASEPEAALALRTVELLRASLLEVSLPAPPPGEVAAPPAVREKLAISPLPSPPGRLPPTLRISLSPGVLVSPGGVGPAAALDAGLAWMMTEHFGAAAFASIPLSRPRLQGTAGSADLATTLVGIGPRFLFTPRANAWAPSVDLGVNAISLQLTASANPGYQAHDKGAWTAAPFVRAGVAFAPHPMLRLRTDLLVTAVLQGTTLQLAGQKVATFGLPLFQISAGVDFGWF